MSNEENILPAHEYSQDEAAAGRVVSDTQTPLYRILAIDPGREKCGLAITDKKGVLLWRIITPRSDLITVVADAVAHWNITQLVVGGSTSSAETCSELAARWPQMALKVIDETGSTLEARTLYWQEKPPHGWRRLTPLSMQVPPEPIDDFAALVLARRFLHGKREN